jgi:zinc/manganese transport system substrate-binding protein
MRTRSFAVPAIAVAAAIVLAGCSPSSATTAAATSRDKVDVVASTNVYGSLVQAIGGSHVTVTSILDNPNQDPHQFEADARTQLAVSKADLIIENGGGYDSFTASLVSATKSTAPVLNVVSLSGIPSSVSDFNEHVFYDYPVVVTLISKIEQRLVRLDHRDASTFRSRAASLTTEVRALETETTALKKAFAGVDVMYTEPVPGYLFQAAGLRNVTPQKFSEAVEEGDDVPPAALNATLKLVSKGSKVRVLAYNVQASSIETELVKKAAAQSGIAVIGVTETLPTGKDYVSWQQANIDHLKAALQK